MQTFAMEFEQQQLASSACRVALLVQMSMICKKKLPCEIKFFLADGTYISLQSILLLNAPVMKIRQSLVFANSACSILYYSLPLASQLHSTWRVSIDMKRLCFNNGFLALET